MTGLNDIDVICMMYVKFEKNVFFKLKFLKTVVYEQIMNVHELFSNITLSRDRMTLIPKFVNNQ